MRSTELWETRPATPEDVLGLLQEGLRHHSAFDPEVDGGAVLTFATPIFDWLDAADLLTRWQDVAAALNSWLGTDLAPRELRDALPHPRKSTLGHLCALVAPRLRVPVFPAFHVAGSACVTAGAFLTLRTALVRAGLPASGARPSSPLPVRTWEDLHAFTSTVSRLAPGVLPVAQVRTTRVRRCSELALFGGLAVLLLAFLASRAGLPFPRATDALKALGLPLALGGFAGMWLTRNSPPASVRFEGLSTLGDVARALASPRVVESPPC
ncbi:hypothetical protein ACLESO_17700 [Pyxidicoccus sp. 3LG]